MKYSHLKQIKDYLASFQKISAIYRVNNTIIKIAFDRDDEVYFEMQRSNSKIFKCDSYTRSKVYNAPFDVVLAKRFNRANILDVELVDDDKILRFKTSVASAYKEEITYLQFEFTGKYTNVIIYDEEQIVLEALRHVDIFSSFREVKVGQKLLSPPSAPYTPKEYPLDDVEKFLYDEYKKELDAKLNSLKKQKLLVLNKKLQKLQKLQATLEDETKLAQEAQIAEHQGNLILSNLHNIKAYQRKVELQDYDGSLVEIEFAKEFSNPAFMAQALFKKSKKAKQKALHSHIERTSILSKIEHTKLFIAIVEDAKDMAKLELLFPKQVQTKKFKMSDSIESFWIEGYKVQLGKNEKGNIELLRLAKAKDIWIHMKDRPSAHLIITTDKQNVPQNIIHEAAKLCVEFSTAQKDKFLVDYTPRREVTIQNGANVLYNKYKTIEVDVR
ncbi:fibronectin-binding protein [Sulfurimonas hongkongensis]|uniref:Fibronectin-binding protein n=1 Tax=Sulfurimonas hongkongensis TaxID=1172190 RepID=T0JLX9_9BACT|nr:NFACT RNA binding domain-containing protein [Sulfurimonas hongkongensis]EQB39121.1 fibronectin-binding protein [Sulfurimonas hongkongensis]